MTESFGIGAGAALLTRLRVELPAAPDQAGSGCPAGPVDSIGQSGAAGSGCAYTPPARPAELHLPHAVVWLTHLAPLRREILRFRV